MLARLVAWSLSQRLLVALAACLPNLPAYAADTPVAAARNEAAAAAEKRGWESSERLDKEYLKELAAKGMTVAEPSDALKKEFARIGTTMTEEWVKAAGADGKSIVDAHHKR